MSERRNSLTHKKSRARKIADWEGQWVARILLSSIGAADRVVQRRVARKIWLVGLGGLAFGPWSYVCDRERIFGSVHRRLATEEQLTRDTILQKKVTRTIRGSALWLMAVVATWRAKLCACPAMQHDVNRIICLKERSKLRLMCNLD